MMKKGLGLLLLVMAVGVGDTTVSIIASMICLTASLFLLSENA